MDWKYLEQNQGAELYKLWNRLSSGSYFPKAVKQVAIPKKGGGERFLGIPTPLDTPQGGVISPLLANIFLHVVFDKWMEKHHPEKPFERYADDIVVHCRTERQAKFMLYEIKKRMALCKLTLHSEKSKIVNLRGVSTTKYSKGFDFLGFTIRPRVFKGKKGTKSIPCICVSQKSKTSIMEKFKLMKLHKRRKILEEIAKEINPVLRGIINYYHKFWKDDMRFVWHQLNVRLLKWVKWEKGLYKKASVRYLKMKYEENPTLFAHWSLVYP